MYDDTHPLVLSLAEYLNGQGARLCTAESCTGGLIAKSLTDVAGSSNWFDRGFVTYSNEAKMDMLGVQESTLKVHGAVSEAVVREMVQGAIQHSNAQYAVAVTGIAGPDGGSESKPVGTVWFGFVLPGLLEAEMAHFLGDRQQIRSQATNFALKRLVQLAQS